MATSLGAHEVRVSDRLGTASVSPVLAPLHSEQGVQASATEYQSWLIGL